VRLAAGQELEHREAASVEGLLTLLEHHQDVDVARRRLLAPHHRPEDADMGHSVAFPDNKQVLSDLGEGMHRYS